MKDQFQLTVIKWFDAYMKNDVDDPSMLEPHQVMETVGFKVKETSEAVSVAHERCSKDGTFRQVTTIPRPYITEVFEFSCKPPRPKKVKSVQFEGDSSKSS